MGVQCSPVLNLHILPCDQNLHAVLNITCGYFLDSLDVVPISTETLFTLLFELGISPLFEIRSLVNPVVAGTTIEAPRPPFFVF